MSEYVYADMVPTGTTCPELRMRVDDIEAAFLIYQNNVTAHAPRVVQARDINRLTDALVAATKQALIEINALHDTEGGAW